MDTKTRRGYLSKFNNYRDWFMSHDALWQRKHMVTCEYCGKKFIPSAPNQKFCGPENPMCYNTRTDSKMANGMWIKNTPQFALTPYAQKVGRR